MYTRLSYFLHDWIHRTNIILTRIQYKILKHIAQLGESVSSTASWKLANTKTNIQKFSIQSLCPQDHLVVLLFINPNNHPVHSWSMIQSERTKPLSLTFLLAITRQKSENFHIAVLPSSSLGERKHKLETVSIDTILSLYCPQSKISSVLHFSELKKLTWRLETPTWQPFSSFN